MKPLSDPDLQPIDPLIETLPNGNPPEPETESTAGFAAVLKNRNFLALWSGQVFSQLADKVYLVLTIAIVTAQFQGENQSISGWVSAITIAFTIPAVLFGFLAGIFVDRHSKKSVLVVTNLLRGGLVFAIPTLLWLCGGQLIAGIPLGFAVLLAVTFLVSTLTQFFAPAEQSVIPLIVPKQDLLSANSLYTTTAMASVIVGFAVGEPMLALADRFLNPLGFGKELAVGGSYAIAGLLLLLIRPHEKVQSHDTTFSQFWQDLKDGLRFLNDHTRVRSALIQLIVLFCVFASLTVLAVRLAEIMPAIKSTQFGFLLAAAGVGMAVGALGVGHVGHQFPRRLLSGVGSIGIAASLAGMSFFTQQLIPTLVLIATMGFCGALVAIPMQTTIQAETPEELRGKVFGLQNNAVNIALSLPLALTGIAEAYVGVRVVLLSLAAIVVAAGLITWYISGQALK
ncbi:MAG TPA: MFS transporter [Oscillatoriales cyanobacterium M59_W2019_021]|nr:MAG: MFS transporter [Cyanobacteria bacterium J055]HIK30951.1 MFS transporter [Oscillatoriales cyanobacterium M4454_W2019_049]HIK52240.1 MFS transporter [Oscillatoriales cyanobacterium M59_W2019_021]